MANTVFTTFKTKIMNGGNGSPGLGINLATDTLKIMLLSNLYTINPAHQYKSDLTNEVSGTGYTAGGLTLTGQTTSISGTTGVFTANNATWSSSTLTARYAVIYKSTGVDATSPLILIFDFVTDQSTSGGDFTIQWNANGILNLA